MKQRIYLIGTGVIAGNHIAGGKALPRDVEFYAADPKPEARAKFSEQFPDVVLFESSDEMLAHSPAQEFDIVAVATPPKFHCSETLKALRSGRNVVCEKPFALNVEEAKIMVEEAKKLGLNVSCCSNRFIGWEANQKVKSLLQEGKIGEPYLVDFIHRNQFSQPSVWWFVNKSMNGGGSTYDWGVYDMAVLTEIFQPVNVTISEAVAQHIHIPFGIPDDIVFDVETTAIATLRFELQDGHDVIIRYERGTRTHGDAMETQGIYGTEGFIKWNWIPFGENLKVSVYKTEAKKLRSEKIYPITESSDWVLMPVREMDRYLRGDKEAKLLVNDDALKVFSIIPAILESAETGQSITINF